MCVCVSIQAAINGNLPKIKEIVQELQKHSCPQLIDVASQANGYNMLHFAVHYKRISVVKFLIDNGAGESHTYVTEFAKTYHLHARDT